MTSFGDLNGWRQDGATLTEVGRSTPRYVGSCHHQHCTATPRSGNLLPVRWTNGDAAALFAWLWIPSPSIIHIFPSGCLRPATVWDASASDPEFAGSITASRKRDISPGQPPQLLEPLARLYVQGTVALARTYHSAQLMVEVTGVSFTAGPPIDQSQQIRAAEVDTRCTWTLKTTPSAGCSITGNYDMEHVGPAAVTHVRGTVRPQVRQFQAIDNAIATMRSMTRGELSGTERNMGGSGSLYAGILADNVVPPTINVDIDPFPRPPRRLLSTFRRRRANSHRPARLGSPWDR